MQGIPAVIALVSAGVQAYGQYRESQQQSEAYKYNAAIATNNAAAARNAASVEEAQVRERNRRIMAAQRARFAKAQVSIYTGSPLTVMAASARQAELDAQIVRYRGELSAIGQEAQSTLLIAQAKSIRQAGIISATSTLLSGVAQAGTIASKAGVLKSSTPTTAVRPGYGDTVGTTGP